MVSRLGLGSSYPAPREAYQEAIARGVSYLYWGSRRSDAMGDAIRSLEPHRRGAIAVAVQSYARLGFLLKRGVESAIRRLQIEQADVLILGWYNSPPPARILDAAMALQERGLVRRLAISGHRRSMFPTLLDDRRYAIWHLRYNAVHRGAEREVFPSLDGLAREERPGVVTYTTTRWGHLCDEARTPPGERTPTGTDCYRFALSDPHVDVALAGPSNLEEMRQALAALELGPLDEGELAWMRRVGDAIYHRDRTSRLRD